MRRIAPFIVLLAAGVAHADGVRFEAHVAQENLTLDQTIELTVTLERDGSQVFESYRAPQPPPDLELLHTGTSQQMQMSFVNNRQSMRMVEQHQYIYKAHKKGSFTIGPASVKVAGQTLTTRPITVHVAPIPKNAMSTVAAPGTSSGVAPPAPAPDTLKGSEDLFVDARLDKPKVYVGEQVTASWRLYTQSDILKYRSLAEPKHEDFWSEDLFVPTGHLGWDRQIVKGQEYAVALLLKKALFPLKAGTLTVTPLEAEATTLQSAFYANASAARRSTPLTVEVMPLPVQGRPPGFDSSNVGQFDLSASVDRTQVKAGEAVTLRITVKGIGNIRNVKLAKLQPDGFKAYEPTTKETLERGDLVRGEKVYTYLLMPTRGGALSLPALELPYFDPTAGRYAVAHTQPISLTVEGDPTKVEASANAPTQDNVLGPQIRPIRNKSTVSSHISETLWRGKFAAALLVAPPAAWLLVLIGDALRRRLARETAGSKRRRARRSARRRMRVAEYHIKAQRPSAFFGECARVIYEHLEYRLGHKVEALTLGELRTHLEQNGFSRETAEAVVRELENCDFARFAPSASGPGEMRAALRRVRNLLGWIERAKPATEKEAA
jgi:hypothetical protein